MVYIDINRSNTHADPLLDSRWAQMWVHMWVHILVILLVYVTKGNTCTNRYHVSTAVLLIPVYFIHSDPQRVDFNPRNPKGNGSTMRSVSGLSPTCIYMYIHIYTGIYMYIHVYTEQTTVITE